MQQFKSNFKDINCKGTISNIQPCLRLNDLEDVGDGTHLLYFNMIGLFSFRELTLKYTIDFWLDFLKSIGIIPDYLYTNTDIEIKFDDQCIWTDGDIGGYCTEFYKNGIEIGNIVNTIGTCIDVGFGLERLLLVLNGTSKSKEEVIIETTYKLIDSGFYPGNQKQNYILRKLLRICQKNGYKIEHEYYKQEVIRQEKILDKYNKVKNKYKDKSDEWWFETFGIDINSL